MPTPDPFFVYRDRIGVRSEIGFLHRQYVGFSRLQPLWIGRTVLPDAAQIGAHVLRLGGSGLLGPVHRLLFRHAGLAPPIALCKPVRVLHAQFARGGALALPLVRRLGLRMVVTLHGGDVSKRKNWHNTIQARRWSAVVHETARFVCVSAAVAEIARSRGVPQEKLIILPIGVEVADHPPPRRAAYHLFVGRFVEKKGVAVLADAVRSLRAQGDLTELVCVGDGPLRPVLETLAREVPGVILTGWLTAGAVHARMTEAISLLVPSVIAGDGDAEGLPSVIAEAMAQGCPVIGSDQGGIAEAVQDAVNGLLVPPGNANALTAAMHRISTDTLLQANLSAAAFAAAAARLNARIQSEKLETLLLSV